MTAYEAFLEDLLKLEVEEPGQGQELSFKLDPSTLPENHQQLLEDGTGVRVSYVYKSGPFPFAKVYGLTQDLAKVFKANKWITGHYLPNYWYALIPLVKANA